jgi:DtxR family transcriptional regulator, Mn-dependent transcriptional regulator
MISSTVEDYLKAFLRIEDMNEKASTSRVARHLDVADASVTDMLRKLQKAGLLEYKPYYGATLTKEGRMVALKILRRHRLIELFLHQIMGYGWEQVHEEAEKLEHVVSDFFVERVDALLNHPVKDPHGEIIPDAQGFRGRQEDICLADAAIGDYTVRRVVNGNPEFLAYLEKENLFPASTFSLLEKAPFQGPLKLLLTGKKNPQYIGLEVAKSIYVSQMQSSDSSARGAAMGRMKRSDTKRRNLQLIPTPARRVRSRTEREQAKKIRKGTYKNT